MEVARDLQEQSRETIRLLLNPTFASSQQALQALEQAERHAEALRAGLVGHLRDGGARWKMLATTLNMSEDTARRRYTSQYIHNRLKPYRTAAEPTDTTPDADNPAELADLYHPNGHQAAYNQLAPVLSGLVRKRRQNLQQIAKHIGCDPSYLYRILNGERMPSWAITSRLGCHCNADLAVLQATWDMEHLRQARVKEATRYRQHTPLLAPAQDVTEEKARATLLRAILTLWRSAKQPAPQRIALASGNKLSADAAQQVLNGTPANWEHLAAFLAVTGGDVDYFRKWWHAAHPTEDTSGARRVSARHFTGRLTGRPGGAAGAVAWPWSAPAPQHLDCAAARRGAGDRPAALAACHGLAGCADMPRLRTRLSFIHGAR